MRKDKKILYRYCQKCIVLERMQARENGQKCYEEDRKTKDDQKYN